jgi:hypothetical protein
MEHRAIHGFSADAGTHGQIRLAQSAGSAAVGICAPRKQLSNRGKDAKLLDVPLPHYFAFRARDLGTTLQRRVRVGLGVHSTPPCFLRHF